MVDAPPSIPLPTCMVEAAQIYGTVANSRW